jgi:hypothetical protein
MGCKNHFSSKGRTNADGTTTLKHEVKPRRFEPEYEKDVLEDLRTFFTHFKAWKAGDEMAHRKAGSVLSRMNGAFWKLHVDNVWSGSKGTTYATKQAIYDAWKDAMEKGNTKIANELLEAYVARLNATDCQKFLLEAITSKTLDADVKGLVTDLITARVEEIEIAKVEKKSKKA